MCGEKNACQYSQISDQGAYNTRISGGIKTNVNKTFMIILTILIMVVCSSCSQNY